jgi:hypothetical protein
MHAALMGPGIYKRSFFSCCMVVVGLWGGSVCFHHDNPYTLFTELVGDRMIEFDIERK